MTDNLKCCFCGAELNDYPDKTTGVRMAVCRNPKCKYDGWHFPVEITQRMIDGKKAQDALKVAIDFIGFVNTSRHTDGALAAMAICKLNKITSITKRDTNE